MSTNNINCETPISLQIKVFLEGAYAGSGQMQSSIPIPAGNPYTTAAPFFNDSTCSLIMPSAIDWVLVKLMAVKNDPTSIALTAPGLLLPTGEVVFCTLCNDDLNIDLGTSYFVAVQHRNHLGILSDEPRMFINGTLTFDFTLQNTFKDAFSIGQIQHKDNSWMMAAGNARQTGGQQYRSINSADETEINNQLGQTGYLDGDINLSGQVGTSDIDLWRQNQGRRSAVDFQ